jgi:DNA-binding response OmpR family regulator
MQRGLDLGATHYITKPFVLSDLMERVEALLAATDDPVR